MLSLVLYGRNDGYGYNLHKRAALSINCMAEVLTGAGDEILFVDYNTPDDFPTFPEAIADTFTANALSRLRVLRVRPPIHQRVSGRTHLKAIEPIARNVAVRRSNPANRWILSTNTDMIFVPRGPDSLTEIAGDLAPGFYHLPRFEIPESLWEGFDRRDPGAVIASVRELGRTLFLNEIVYGAECIKYDAPGDFQLILREDLFRFHGFDEEMLLGWHVDSNIAKRLFLEYGVVGDVVDRLFGYHCDHTRQVTPMHQYRAASNDPRRFIDGVARPELPRQADTWGCPDDEIEEVHLGRGGTARVYLNGLRGVLTGEWREPARAWYTTASFGETAYDARHVLPFLADLFACAPRRTTVAWFGTRADTFGMFCEVWRRFGFEGEILIEGWASLFLWEPDRTFVRVVRRPDVAAGADILVFDFGPPSDTPADTRRIQADPAMVDRVADELLRGAFHDLAAAEQTRIRDGAPPRRFVCVDAVHNAYETLAQREIAAASTPFAARLRHGYVIPQTARDRWLSQDPVEFIDRMRVGISGRRTPEGIVADFGHRGYLVTGPDEELPLGEYEVEFGFRSYPLITWAGPLRRVIVEVVAGSECVARKRVNPLVRVETLSFSISPACYERRGVVEFRILRGRFIGFVLRSVKVRRRVVPASEAPEAFEVLQRLGIPAREFPGVTASGRA